MADKLYQCIKEIAKNNGIKASPQHDLYKMVSPYFINANYFDFKPKKNSEKIRVDVHYSVKYAYFDDLTLYITDPLSNIKLTDKIRANSGIAVFSIVDKEKLEFDFDNKEESWRPLAEKVFDHIEKRYRNFEKEVKLKEIKDDKIEGKFIISKNDFDIKKQDFNRYKYKIQILKSNKINLQESQNNEEKTLNEDKNKDENNNISIINESKKQYLYLFLDDHDIYEIISKFYSYNFFFLDTSQYNLDVAKGKLDSLELSNQLLGMLFQGEYKLLDFIINENEFRIPFMDSSGLPIEDVAFGSNAQVSMIGLVINLVLLYQASSHYNIARLDEIGSSCDSYNRSQYIQVLNAVINILHMDQLFVISHDIDLDNTMCDIIKLKGYDGFDNSSLQGNVIFDYDEIIKGGN